MQPAADSLPAARREESPYLPEGTSLLRRLLTAVKALRTLERQPDDPVAAALLNAALDGTVFRREADRLAKTELGRGLLADRPTLQKGAVDLDALAKQPEGTVGRAFADYFVANGIQPFSTPYEIRNEVDYLIKWFRETHDLHHIVTGYGTDPIGEMELQAFALGNLGFRVAAMILVFAALLRPRGLPPMWRYWGRVRAAYRRGRASANLFDVRYDRYLDAPVARLREELRLEPAA